MLLLLYLKFQTKTSLRTALKTLKQPKRFKRVRLICKAISEFAETTALGKQERPDIKCGFELERTIFNRSLKIQTPHSRVHSL